MRLRGHWRWRGLVSALIVLLSGGRALALGQFDINLIPGPTLQNTPDALAAFQRAAQSWEQYISTPVTINIDADIQPNSSLNVIGSTNVFTGNLNLDYTAVRDAMAARSTRPGDAILASLPTSAQVTASVPAGGIFDKATIGLTLANQKALGLLDGSAGNLSVDAQMVFNSNFAFDYDNSNGVDSGKMDFQTVATHEIGHVLGFLSDTDDYDSNPNITDNATTLDLFRFNAKNLPTTASQFTSDPRELTPGAEASFDDLDNVFPMSTGAINGDGNQASHWIGEFVFNPNTGVLSINPPTGIMDPSLSYGTIESITNADLRAMELIGWDTTGAVTVPEPSAVGIMALVLGVGIVPWKRLPRG